MFGSLSGSFCAAITICGHVCLTGPAKSRTHPLGVSGDLSGTLCGFCATGGGSRGGGVFGPLGTTVPWGDSPREGRAAHGPLHLAVRISLGNLVGVCARFVILALQVVVCFIVKFLFFAGVGVLSGTLSPSRPDPCLVLLSASPLLFFVWSVRRRRVLVFFFFSLSQALGKPKPPLGVWGFPLCFFILHTHSAFDPYFVLDTYTTATPCTCFFFCFFVVVARFPVRCLAFRRRRLFVFVLLFFKRESSGLTGHTPHAPCVFVPFSLSPPHRVYLPFWPCVLSFWRFVGVPFWAPGVFWILPGLL